MCYDGDENHMLGHVHTDLSCKFDIELMSGERGGGVHRKHSNHL